MQVDHSPQIVQTGSAVVIDVVSSVVVVDCVVVVVVVVVVVIGVVGVGVVTGGLIPRLLMEYFLPLALNFPVNVQPFSVANETGTFWHFAFLDPVHFGVTLMTSEQSHLKETFMVHLSLTLPHLTWP